MTRQQGVTVEGVFTSFKLTGGFPLLRLADGTKITVGVPEALEEQAAAAFHEQRTVRIVGLAAVDDGKVRAINAETLEVLP